MKKNFTKRDLHTGDIIETRNGERGVVILEQNCIVYQAGGLDCMEVFTDDLFVDGLERNGDIFKVYHDSEGPLGFQKLFGLKPVFVRKNNKETIERAAELTDKYDFRKGRISVMVFEPSNRKCEKTYIKATSQRDFDLALSEAPSMIVCGQLKTDRTFVSIPNAENLFLVYNKYQEEWHCQNLEKEKEWGFKEEAQPIITIPEKNIRLYGRCLLVRMNEETEIVDLQEEDLGKLKEFLHEMK